MIDKRRWGEGLATEVAGGIVAYARGVLRLQRLIALVTPGNDASARVAVKVGMAFEREYTDEHGPYLVYARSLTAVA